MSAPCLMGWQRWARRCLLEQLPERQVFDGGLGTWETGNVSYYIDDGVFVLEQTNGTTKNMYRFTIVNWNQITVYCFKDGSTHTLYRQ